MADFSVDRYNWLGQEQYTTNEWVDLLTDLFGQLLGTFYEETDPVDDFDRIYRQQEAQEFNDLLDDIRNGSATWRDIANFEVYYLEDVDGFQEFVDDMVDSALYKGLYDDIRAANGDPELLGSIFEEYGNAGIETNPYIQQDLASTGSATSVLTGTVDNAILEDMIRKAAIGDGIFGGEVDFEDLPGYGGIWEGLIRHIKVIGKGLPLPIPDWLPLPGIFELPTIGEIFDTITGPWKEAAQDALRNCMDPDGDGVDDKSASQCLEEQSVIDILVDGIGNATSDIYDATAEKVQEILDETVDCVSNPATCAQEVFDKLKDIFGEGAVDPTSTGGNIPDWMKVIIIGGAYGDEILGELEDLFGGDIDDDGTIGVGPEEPEFGYCQDGVTEKANAEGTNCQEYAEFGYCADGITKKQDAQGTNCEEYTPDYGMCDDGFTPKEDAEGTNCPPGEPIVNEGDPCELGDGTAGTYQYVGGELQCIVEEQTCDNGATNYPDCDECPSGQTLVNNQCQEDTGTQECNNGATQESGCETCEDGTRPDEHQGGNCNNPLINPEDPFNCARGSEGLSGFEAVNWNRYCSDDWCPEGVRKETVDGVYGANCSDYVAPVIWDGECSSPRPNAAESFDAQAAAREWDAQCGATHCPDGTEKQEGFDCAGNPIEPEECAKPDGTLTGATPESGCEQCPQGFTFDFNGICQPDTGFSCDDYNRTTNEDGTCGPCKEGYVQDTSLPNEPCVAIFDGCPPGFELVNGECTPVVCPEGQAYCIDTDGCVEIGTCPSDPPEPDEDGGGGGGGGGGGFTPDDVSFSISGDPQLLGRARFGTQDFVTPLFTGNQGGGTDFPIARFLQGKGDLV